MLNEIYEELNNMFGESNGFPDQFIDNVIDSLIHIYNYPDCDADDLRKAIMNIIRVVLEQHYNNTEDYTTQSTRGNNKSSLIDLINWKKIPDQINWIVQDIDGRVKGCVYYPELNELGYWAAGSSSNTVTLGYFQLIDNWREPLMVLKPDKEYLEWAAEEMDKSCIEQNKFPMTVKRCPECGSGFLNQQTFFGEFSAVFTCLSCAKKFKLIVLEDLDKQEE